MGKKQKIRELEKRVENLSREYRIDQRELGKIMVIVSTTLMLFSMHAALSFQSASQSMDRVNQDLDRVSGILESSNFQQALETLQSLNSNAISQQLDIAMNAFNSAESSIEEADRAEKQLEQKYRMYQWLTLIAIMGEVAGIAIVYV